MTSDDSTPRVLAAGVLDGRNLRGTGGIDVSWTELGSPAPGDGRTLRTVFGHSDTTYRRLDRISRSLVLAAHAAGLGEVLTPDELRDAALIAETHVGCLEIDRRYTASLAGELVAATIFPYTLPTTSLGEVALRFKLHGPTMSISVDDDRRGAALREAWRMLAAGEVRHVVAASVDVLDEPGPGLPAGVRAVVVVVGAPEFVKSDRAVMAWPDAVQRPGNDPFGALEPPRR
ncbi:MAG: hypothetical protein NXI31_16155 [bacterium]|nr:hypothetical protein [bacterium]